MSEHNSRPDSLQLTLIGEAVGVEPQVEAVNRRELNARLREIRGQAVYVMRAVDYIDALIKRNVQLPDVAHALGLKPVIPRRTKSKLWVLRPGTDAAFVVELLEGAGRRGLTEDELVLKLQEAGRLQNLKNARAALHWTVKNLQRRSQALARTKRGAWRLVGRVPRA